MQEFRIFASELSNEPHTTDAWLDALDSSWRKVGAVFPDLDAFLRFARCFSCPDQWLVFNREMANERQMKILLQAVDASAHSIEEWIPALQVVGEWMQQNDRETSMERRIGYLSCCAESISSHPGVNLAEVANEMLTTHGME